MAAKRKTTKNPAEKPAERRTAPRSAKQHLRNLQRALEDKQGELARELETWMRSFPVGDLELLRAAAITGRRQGRDAAEALWDGWTPSEAAARAVLARFRRSGRIARTLVSKEEVDRVRAELARAMAARKKKPTTWSRPLAEALRPRSKAEAVAEYKAFMATQPFPHFEAVPGRTGYFVRIDMDGTRTLGRLVGTQFRPELAK
jgi:hypothetical protein